MSNAQNYYDSLLSQGYDPTSALGYTQQYYPEFTVATPVNPPVMPGMPTPPLQTIQNESNNSNKKMLIIGGSIGGGLLVIGVVLFLLLAGGSDATSSSLIGTWVNESGSTITMHSDGDLTGSSMDENMSGSWSESGDEFTTVLTEGNQTMTSTVRFLMSSSEDAMWTLTISAVDQDGNDFSAFLGDECTLVISESMLEDTGQTYDDVKSDYDDIKPDWCA